MGDPLPLPCDGCGQPASSEHISRRFARLEWTTRYRPVHIATVLLGAAAPSKDAEFLYAPTGEFAGEAGRVLEAAGISRNGKSAEVVLAEFQRRGLLLSYVLECPVEPAVGNRIEGLLGARFAATLARLRRSFRPQRVIPISRLLEPLLTTTTPPDVGGTWVLDRGRAFALDQPLGDVEFAHLKQRLAGTDPASR